VRDGALLARNDTPMLTSTAPTDVFWLAPATQGEKSYHHIFETGRYTMSQRLVVRLAKLVVCMVVGLLAPCLCVTTLADDQTVPKPSSGSDQQAANSIVSPRSWKGLQSRVEEDGVAVVISESGRTLYGYSGKTGSWDRVSVQNPDGRPIYPLVGGEVACAVVGPRAYGFSGTTGRWDVVRVTPGRIPMVSLHFCCVDDGSKLYTFSNSSGRWSMADMSQDAEDGATSSFGDVEEGKDRSAPLLSDKLVEQITKQKAETWQIELHLGMPSLEPEAVQYAIFDKDPVPGYIAQVKLLRQVYKQQIEQADTKPWKDMARAAQMRTGWDNGFKYITGENLNLLTKKGTVLSSNGRAEQKWVVTRTVDIQGRPVCWCIPVEVKIGEKIDITCDKSNTFDLQTPYDNAMGKPLGLGNEEETK
jgi:hypothetical protein